MKKRWNWLRARLSRLPRGWRVARNLSAAFLAAALLWVVLDFPALTADQALRRAERQSLLAPAEQVLKVKNGRETAWLKRGEGWLLVGKTTRLTDSAFPPLPDYWVGLEVLALEDGPTVAALPVRDRDGAAVVAVTGLPAGTVSGELEVDLLDVEAPFFPDDWRVADETFRAGAEADEDGWLIFRLLPHQDHGAGEMCAMEALWQNLAFWGGMGDRPYRLRLLDQTGREVAEVSGTLPPDQVLWY